MIIIISQGLNISVSSEPMGTKKKTYIYICTNEGCINQVVNGGLCKRHGAEVKRCKHEGCTNLARKGGVCVSHGAKVKICRYEGCKERRSLY